MMSLIEEHHWKIVMAVYINRILSEFVISAKNAKKRSDMPW